MGERMMVKTGYNPGNSIKQAGYVVGHNVTGYFNAEYDWDMTGLVIGSGDNHWAGDMYLDQKYYLRGPAREPGTGLRAGRVSRPGPAVSAVSRLGFPGTEKN